MNSIKCQHCGLVNFATAESCKRCAASFDEGGLAGAGADAVAPGADAPHGVEFADVHATESACPVCRQTADGGFCRSCQAWVEPAVWAAASVTGFEEGRRSGPGGRRALVICAALAAACTLLFVASRSFGWFDDTPAYAGAIQDSEQFKAPVTVRVNRKPMVTPAPAFQPFDKHTPAGTANAAAYVLEHLGLLRLETSTTQEKVESGMTVPVLNSFSGASTGERRSIMMTHRTDRLDISLTARGTQAAEDWEEFEEEPHSLPGGHGAAAIPWWRVPLGRREFVRVDSVGTVNKIDGRQLVEVKFVWRWRPDELGESFDTSSDAFKELPEIVRYRMGRISWDSKLDYVGVATLAGIAGKWQVEKIKYSGGTGEVSAPGD